MKLALDIGNSSTKAGLFHNDKLKKHWNFEGLISQKEFLDIAKNNLLDAVIISSVRKDSQKLEQFISARFKTINLSPTPLLKLKGNKTHGNQLKLPFKNLYKTPETLGRDRMANAAAAACLFENKNTLVIDAGTCLKFDFVDAKGNYLGGSISPGLQMRYKALHQFTGLLPLINIKKQLRFIGRTTEESIRAGVQQGMTNEIAATIIQYNEKYPALNIILTGGDWRLFVKHLKKAIFADPFLTLKGLHCILDYNT